ncbi:MAG: dihydropteroate synthase [Verrucomicrobia bacterium]|nr:dihydropteroate synthase [Verrucomicrobiota bacterium]
MIFIGERINTGFKDIKQAVLDKDPKPLQEWARKQAEAGANYIDVNLGAVSSKPADMCWMIETVQAAVETPISIDTNKVAILSEAIKACKKPPLLNSTTSSKEKLDPFLEIAGKYGASMIGLAMDESGTPKESAKRVECAGMIASAWLEAGLPMEHLFLDPIVMPLKFMQDQAKEFLEGARQFTMISDPPPHIICGLSNISSKATEKKLINRTFLVMAIANGLDATIADVLDTDLINAARTAELMMNREIYADAYVKV